MDIHNWVFEKVKSNLPAKTSLAKTVSQVLDINVTNCYKRIRGEVSLSAEELVQLLIHFDISLDEYKGFSSKHRHMSGQRPDFIKDSKSLLNYLTTTYQTLRNLPEVDHCLYYSARDMPLFYYFFSENLIRFKHLVWLRNSNYDDNRHYGMADIPTPVVTYSYKLYELHQSLCTVELWTPRTLNNQLLQIDSLFQTGIINQEEALELLEEMLRLVQQLKVKIPGNPLKKWILSDYLTMANNALLVSPVGRQVFLSFAGINYVTSSNASLAEDLGNWFEQQMEMGLLLNEDSVACDRFFKRVENDIEKFKIMLQSKGDLSL